jgi:formate-dependent nitrite reductase membrane component NrfD
VDTDLVLTIGVVIAALSVPSLLGAWADGRLPRFGAAMALAAAGLITFAVVKSPLGYTLGEVPTVMLRVLARVLN